jgi:hypothetical protein
MPEAKALIERLNTVGRSSRLNTELFDAVKGAEVGRTNVRASIRENGPLGTLAGISFDTASGNTQISQPWWSANRSILGHPDTAIVVLQAIEDALAKDDSISQPSFSGMLVRSIPSVDGAKPGIQIDIDTTTGKKFFADLRAGCCPAPSFIRPSLDSFSSYQIIAPNDDVPGQMTLGVRLASKRKDVDSFQEKSTRSDGYSQFISTVKACGRDKLSTAFADESLVSGLSFALHRIWHEHDMISLTLGESGEYTLTAKSTGRAPIGEYANDEHIVREGTITLSRALS